jgi:hypothetical protein
MYRRTEKVKAKILRVFLCATLKRKNDGVVPTPRSTQASPPLLVLQLNKLFLKVYQSNTIFSDTDGETQ